MMDYWNHFDRLGLSESKLDPDTFKLMVLFCKCAKELGIKDTRIASFQIAWSNLLLQNAQLERELESLLAFNNFWKAKIVKAEGQLNVLRHAREALIHKSNLEAVNSKKKLQEISMFKSKCGDYEQDIARHKNNLEEAGYHERLNHSNITKMKAEHDSLKEELKETVKEVESYQDLPPDLQLARFKVAEAKRKLEKLKQKIGRECTVAP
ncbi:HAUS augmin-like complex subunit 1 [Artemia franciscana]|uniref:Uncharacterized protein n=1 Tax=Artemia franciscana TaxID=6661 RepID=A0AA88IPB8_ARTSF|nr:hypothetical protein QYM36_000987 [Artemia franciscana]